VPVVAVLWICTSWGRVEGWCIWKVCKITVHCCSVYCHSTSVFLSVGQTLGRRFILANAWQQSKEIRHMYVQVAVGE
jgi:hypothetical protein